MLATFEHLDLEPRAVHAMPDVAYRRRFMRKLFVVALAVLCPGCTSDRVPVGSSQPERPAEDSRPGPTDPPTSSADVTLADSVTVVVDGAVDGPVMRHPIRSGVEEGLDAEVRGVLELEDGCLYLSIEDTDERYPVLWPAQTVWDADREVVVVPTGDEIAVGGLAYGGGGYFYVDDIEPLAGREAADLAERCVDNRYGEIAVVNNYATAIGPG